ncbi:sensor histidine kinase [Hyalangium minutum]|uniref:histidine kinase n=1 Tax=Hyalangium minutum TaxID=394096 RepID=A0A085WRU6_9BACT|nr:sensor histidine kinase [Hyalangium minutum]
MPAVKAPGSLARSTLIRMGVRIGVIIALTTLVSYLHIFRSFRDETLVQMERTVAERTQREQAIFVLAQDNHAVLKQALAERLEAWSQQDPTAAFERLFSALPDGTIRNNPQGFDGRKMPGVFVPKGVPLDAELRRRILASYEVVSQYGPAFHVRFTSTGVTLPEGPIIGYFPEGPTYFQDLEPTFSWVSMEYFKLSQPEANPKRESLWTGIYEDPPSKIWFVTVSTPLDVGGRHVATFNHDVLLADLMHRTIGDHLPGGYNVLFRDDGQLIAHPLLKVKSGAAPYNLLNDPRPPEQVFEQPGTGAQRADLRTIFERVKAREPQQRVLELPERELYVAVGRLEGTGWTFVTVLPESVVSSAAFQVARYVLLFGMCSLLIELGIMFWVLRQQITRPLVGFTQAADQVATGNFQVKLESSRDDELGRLANAFELMAHEVHQREEALRQANEGLEQRVEERTKELQEVHKQLVETARQVGRAEIATNVLHNVGNVLNSVFTSAVVARERLGGLKIDSVEKVASLLEEHQGDLGNFLSKDERGRNAVPFLKRLGTHLQSERQEIQNLLAELSRHTEHIGTIVKLQQRYARTPQKLVETVDFSELVEDALRINHAALTRHGVDVERDLAHLPPVLTEKHKLLMILVNLISNAKYALEVRPEGERILTIRLTPPAEGRFRLEVSDNGMGIAPEMLTRIFQYGFTTREEGHGFGLHSSALAAQEMGGTLTAHSEGLGKGATFRLELPYTPEQQEGLSHA